MGKPIFLIIIILGMQFGVFGWTSNGHERLAEAILSHPTIANMIKTAGLNKDRILQYCADGDKYAAHDLYQNGDWYGGFKSWSSYKSEFLDDAKIGTVRKDMPSKWKYIPEVYDLSVYYKNVETVTPGATHTTTDLYGRTITITDPAVRTLSIEKYWIDSEQMFGLFLHNLTDCAVPVGHNPARTVFPGSGNTEKSFEATAANNNIPSLSEINLYTTNEISAKYPNNGQLSDTQFETFWTEMATKFENEIINSAKELKTHVDNNWYYSTTSAWLTPACFKALLEFSVPVVCKYVEYTNAYISRSGKQPSNTIPVVNIAELKKVNFNISPIIQLLLD